MSQLIYILKIELLSGSFNMSQEERSIIHRMAKFIAYFYSKLLLRSRITVFAAVDDFHFMAAMTWYQEEDSAIATAVLASINRHLWYLTEELIVLAIFNENVLNFTRTLLTKKFYSTSRQTSFKLGKPKFPTIEINNSTPTYIHSFLGPRSWLFSCFY